MTVRLEDNGSCLIVRNQEEKRGAISPEFYATILRAVEMAKQPRVRCIILTGGAFFCAGGNLKLLKDRAKLSVAQRREKIEMLHDVIRAMHHCDVPLIAAIEGGAAGAGLSLALACDMIVAAKGASFTAAYVKAGLTPDGGLTHALARLVPHQMAAEMCLLGRSVSVERFFDLGVVSQVSGEGNALEAAECIAGQLAQGPRQAQSRIRQLLAQAGATDLSTQLDWEANFMAEAQGSQEGAEGISAFLEKRPAEFN